MTQQPTAQEELAGLDRVLSRLATTDEDKLEKVLSKLVPTVIGMLKTPHDLSRKKIMEILTHVNKRIKGQTSIKLPIKDLLELISVAPPAGETVAPPSNAMARSFALVYLEMAMERASPQERREAVTPLLLGISLRPPAHRAICLRLALSGLETAAGSVMTSNVAALAEPKAKAMERFPFLCSPDDRSMILDYCYKYLLYQPVSSGPKASTPLAAAAMAVTPPEPKPELEEACAGLSLSDMRMLEDKGGVAVGVLSQRKAGIIGMLSAASTILDAGEILLLLLVGACDPHNAVSSPSEDLLKRLCAVDSSKPAVDLERKELVAQMMALFHGDSALTKDTDVPLANRRQPAGTPVRCRLMSLFVRSVAAANMFPSTVQTVSECMYGSGTNMRLKQQGMEFLFWVFKHAAEDQLKAIGPSMLQNLLQSLEEDTSASASAVAIRGFAYQAIGSLAQRIPKMLGGRTDVAQLFFRALSEEPAGIRATLSEACSSLSGAFRSEHLDESQTGELEQLLLSSINSHTDTVRMCAVQWANRLFPWTHGPSRYICALACGDTKLEVRDEGLRGLRLLPSQQNAAASAAVPGSGDGASDYPDLMDMLKILKELNPRLFLQGDTNRALPIQPKSYLALLRFVSACQRCPTPPTGTDPAPTVSQAASCPPAYATPLDYLLFLEGALCRDASGDLVAAALEAILETVAADQRGFRSRYSSRMAWLRSFLGHVNSAARLAAARLMGAAVAGMDSRAVEELLPELTALYPSTAGSSSISSKFEDQEGAITASGYVLAQSLTGQPLVSSSCLETAAVTLHQVLMSSNTLMAATAAQALGLASLRGPLPLPHWSADPSGPAAMDTDPAPAAPPACDAEAPVSASDAPAAAATPSAEGTTVAAKTPETASPGAPQVIQRLAELIGDKDVKVVVRAVAAAGFLMASHPSRTDITPVLLEVLFKLSTSKAEEVQFAVGEAISFAFGEVPVSMDRILLSNFSGLAEEFSVLSTSALQPTAAAALPEQQQDGANTVRPVNPAVEKNRCWMMDKLLQELVHNSRAEVRCAAAVWLVSLLTYCPRASTLLQLLGQIQEALSQLLGDSNELTQEMASRGIGLVYSRGDEATKAKLVEALVGVLQGGAKAKQAVKLTADTKVFEEGALGTAPAGGASRDSGEGSNLSTYKELCSLATDLGQPDLIYKFMDLAHHNQALNTRRGAAFGVAGIARMAGSQLSPHIGALIPKLYRYQYDPNQRVQEAMVLIWRSLVDDTRKTMDTHFAAIIKELLQEMGGRLWRNRQAACAALADLLQGRRWPELQQHFHKVWSMTLRCMDDIKETVRRQAFSLVRSVRGLTLRLVDPLHSPAEDCQQALGQLMPLLLEQGLGSSVVEIQAIALDTVSKACKAAAPDALRPQLVPVVQAMLEALSSLEDARLNYAEQHAERLGFDQEKLESARVSASRSSPMSDTLDLCGRFSDAASLELLVPMLAGLIKRGVGLNTKVGTARFIRALMSRSSSTDAKSHTPVLLRALIASARAEHSLSVKKAYAGAAAEVCKHASSKRIEKLVEEACGLYLDASDDRDSRYVGGLLLHELLRVLPDVFAGHAAAVLPLAFSAKMDDDKDVARVWKEVWEEGVSSEAGAVRLFASEIVASLVTGLGSSQWSRKKACADAVVHLTQLGGDLLGSHAAQLAQALLSELPGRLWDGKESILDAVGALCAAAPPEVFEPTPGCGQIVDAVIAAVSRKKASYRSAALRCLKAILTNFKRDFFDKVAPIMLSSIEAHCSIPASTVNSNNKEEEADKTDILPLPDSVQCLEAAYCHQEAEEEALEVDGQEDCTPAVTQATKIVGALQVMLQANLAWQQLAVAVQACHSVLKRAVVAKVPAHVLGAWCNQLLPPVAAVTLNFKAQQARLDGLTCIEDMVTLVSGSLSEPVVQAARECAQSIQAIDKGPLLSVAVRILGALAAS